MLGNQAYSAIILNNLANLYLSMDELKEAMASLKNVIKQENSFGQRSSLFMLLGALFLLIAGSIIYVDCHKK